MRCSVFLNARRHTTMSIRTINSLARRHPWVASMLSGLLMMLSNAPYDHWYLSYIAYVPLFLAVRGEPPLRQGLAFALACSIIAVNWWHSTIIYSFWFFLLIVSLLCLSFFLWGVLSWRFRCGGRNAFLALFMPAVIWVGIERILSSEIVGIPCNIGISQSSQAVLIQSASFFGIYTTSFLIVLVNTTLALLLEDSTTSIQAYRRSAVTLGAAIFLANYLYGYRLIGHEAELGDTVTVAVIQPVIDSDLYLNGWRNPETRQYIRDTLEELTDRALQRKPELLVWPEGGNGYFNMRIPELRDSLYEKAMRHGTDLLISSNDLDEDGRKYNTLFSISKHGELLGRYNKVNLIPGAEDAYTPGEKFHPIASSEGLIGPSICYESNFPSPLRKVTAGGAELLVVSTSDAAFKKTSLTINHTRTAVFRAVENNRWVIHASNTGPSVIVSPKGRITRQAGFYERGILSGKVSYISHQTLFTRYGYRLPMLFALATLIMLGAEVWKIVRNQPDVPRKRWRDSGGGELAAAELEMWVKSRARPVLYRYIPVSLLYLTFLSLIAASSIAIVYRQVEREAPLSMAFREFMTPLDSLEPDRITERFLQAGSNTCGPAVMAYIFSYFGKDMQEKDLVHQVHMTDRGTSMLELKKLAINHGFSAMGVKENYGALLQEPLPVIAYINESHYVVVNRLTEYEAYLFDPAIGHVRIPRQVFENAWNGYLLLVRTRPIVPSYASGDEDDSLPLREAG